MKVLRLEPLAGQDPYIELTCQHSEIDAAMAGIPVFVKQTGSNPFIEGILPQLAPRASLISWRQCPHLKKSPESFSALLLILARCCR